MVKNFDFLANLPLIVFGISIFVIFCFFVRAIVILLTAKEDKEKFEKGKEKLLLVLWALLVFLFFFWLNGPPMTAIFTPLF